MLGTSHQTTVHLSDELKAAVTRSPLLHGCSEATVIRAVVAAAAGSGHGPDRRAWVVGTVHQGAGFASEGAAVMATWLRKQGVGPLVADVHPDHAASQAFAGRLGLTPTEQVVDGEVRWTGPR